MMSMRCRRLGRGLTTIVSLTCLAAATGGCEESTPLATSREVGQNDEAAAPAASATGGFNPHKPRLDAPVSIAPTGLEPGQLAPDFELADGQHANHRLSDYRGQIVVLDFWATWCGPCRQIMPQLQTLHEKYADQPVQIIGISAFERGGDPVAYMQNQNLTYPLLISGDRVGQRYNVRGIPMLYVIAPDGTVVLGHSGASPQVGEHLSQIIDGLLNKFGAPGEA